MPACIAHALFAEHVLRLCRQQDIPVYDPPMAMLGAQGPDVFFFHRALPWQWGRRGFSAGQAMHRTSPAALLSAMRDSMYAETRSPEQAKGYMQGFLCHYALDRTAHPFVRYWQRVLRQEQPAYGHADIHYHFRIESALDTLLLRQKTGRTPRDYPLTNLIPRDHEGRYAAFARLYLPVLRTYLGHTEATPERIALAPQDMREALFWMTDKRQFRRRVIHLAEILCHTGPIGTSLLRPREAEDWDYANSAHRLWHNPDDPARTSTQSFHDLWEEAAAEAVRMMDDFFALPEHPMEEITGDRGFSSNISGIYIKKEG